MAGLRNTRVVKEAHRRGLRIVGEAWGKTAGTGAGAVRETEGAGEDFGATAVVDMPIDEEEITTPPMEAGKDFVAGIGDGVEEDVLVAPLHGAVEGGVPAIAQFLEIDDF